MTTARKHTVDLNITPYYHCVSRCVRRSYLCGFDEFSGKSYEHRRAWVEQRILLLATIYCIDVCAYAVMSNHYHLVVHVNREKAQHLSDHEVIERWGKIHSLHPLTVRYLSGELMTKSEKRAAQKLVNQWRECLYSLSWMMKDLNMDIAKQANVEDGCTGHFWEGRFKSQALLDEQALLAAMTYVDLNPVRAKIAPTPEMSNHTSIKYRLDSMALHQAKPNELFPFSGNEHQEKNQGIPFNFNEYLELLDCVGRQHRDDERGKIDSTMPNIMRRIHSDKNTFLLVCSAIEGKRTQWVGSQHQLKQAKAHLKQHRIHGICL